MDDQSKKPNLLQIATQAMVSNGLEPDFSPEALKQLEGIQKPAADSSPSLRDLTSLLWCSIDNDDSRDLDQLTVAEKLTDGKTRIWVAVADVDSLVKLGSPLDLHARKNTTSVYTGVKIFPMLPEKLSTNLTSLNDSEERLSVIAEMVVDSTGQVVESQVYRAKVKNKAKLAYNGVGAWLEGQGPLPPAAAKVSGMDSQLKMQDEAAQKMRTLRHTHGALDFQTLQPRAVTEGETVIDLQLETQNRAGELIEDFMVAANGVTARYLTAANFPTMRRVVKIPERWDRIVEVAKGLGGKLPTEPDSKALGEFLTTQKKKDPVRFPDLSLTIVKLMGRGEYVLEVPGQAPMGHFGLAVRDYNHSTAPNRRYPDLITQRLLKAALAKQAVPYSPNDLSALASHCTQQENAADKVERQVRKSASAMFMSSRIDEHFEAIVTGVNDKGYLDQAHHPRWKEKLVQGSHGLDVGDTIRVKLISVNVEQGYIDFVATSR